MSGFSELTYRPDMRQFLLGQVPVGARWLLHPDDADEVCVGTLYGGVYTTYPLPPGIDDFPGWWPK